MTLEEILNNLLVISKVKNKTLGFQFENQVLCRIHNLESESLVGNIYCGYVKDVVKNINAAFVEFDSDKKGFLSLNNIPFPVKQGDKILVQVSGDKVKTKDYLLTWKINIPGAAVVLTVGDTNISISRKIKDKELKESLKESLLEFSNKEYGFILRTNSTEYTIDEIKQQAEKLILQYNDYKNKLLHGKAKTAIHIKNHSIDLCKNFVTKSKGKIITDVALIYKELTAEQINVLWNDDSKVNLINKYSLEKHIGNALNRHVWLKSGAYLVIEQTEAMTVIDVNTGKADMHTNRKQTLFKINKEALGEIARQLKIRNISGTIIVDLINVDTSLYEELIQYMRESVMDDFVLCSVVDITKLGLMEITRKKQEPPLYEILK